MILCWTFSLSYENRASGTIHLKVTLQRLTKFIWCVPLLFVLFAYFLRSWHKCRLIQEIPLKRWYAIFRQFKQFESSTVWERNVWDNNNDNDDDNDNAEGNDDNHDHEFVASLLLLFACSFFVFLFIQFLVLSPFLNIYRPFFIQLLRSATQLD